MYKNIVDKYFTKCYNKENIKLKGVQTMDAFYRVDSIYTDESGDIYAKCYDIIYEEDFEKYLGNPDEFDGRENASAILKDSTYEMTDDVRSEIQSTFGVEEFDADQDYDGYQFYDFGDDEFEDEPSDDELDAMALAMSNNESFNLREALNGIDINTDNKYDLLNLYEACNLSENEKRALANIVYDQKDAQVIYDTLNDRFVKGEKIGMPERVKDGVIHEDYEFICPKCADHTGEELELDSYGHKTFRCASCGYDSTNEDEWKPLDLDESKSIKEEKTIDDYTVGDDLNFIGNAQIIKASQLPKIGEKFKGGIVTSIDKDGFEEGYVIYRVGVTEEDSLDIYDEFEVNTAHWLFAIKGFRESTDEFDFDDEFNAYYDGYTSELTPNEKRLLALGIERDNWGDLLVDNEETRKEYSAVRNKAKKIAQEKGMTLSAFVDTLNEALGNKFISTFKADIEKVAVDVITNKLGYESDFANEYIIIDVRKDRFSEGDPAIVCEIRTEMSYDECMTLADELNPVLNKYFDDEPYFDMEDSHTLITYLDPDSLINKKALSESSEEEPYTKEMIEQDLKSLTKNFTENEGELKCGFEEEKRFALEILKKHYKVVEASGDDRRNGTWYHISYAEPKTTK